MNFNLRRVAQSLAITAAFAMSGAMEAGAQTDVFIDTFDGAPTNGATRVFVPDNSANGGTFTSPFDVFGIVDRNVNDDFADDTASDPMDFDGLVPSSKTDLFLGFEDVENADNVSGEVSVSWTISTAGLTDLNLSFDAAARGDFEVTDVLEATASFDGGAATTVFTSTVDEDGMQTYTLEGGIVVELNDPFLIDQTPLSNVFQNFSFPISGAGTQLTLTLTYVQNAGNEVLAIDNLSVTSGGGDLLKGDVDLSGVVDFADIPAFIAVLQGGGFQAEADCDCSGGVDFSDIPAFIMILQGG